MEKTGKNVIHIDFPQKLFQVNENEKTTAEYTQSSNDKAPFAIFAINSYSASFGQTGSYSYGYKPCNYKFYSMQVTEKATGTVINDFVPCINEDGLAGLFDLVNETFYSSSVADKPFTAGPPV